MESGMVEGNSAVLYVLLEVRAFTYNVFHYMDLVLCIYIDH